MVLIHSLDVKVAVNETCKPLEFFSRHFHYQGFWKNGCVMPLSQLFHIVFSSTPPIIAKLTPMTKNMKITKERKNVFMKKKKTPNSSQLILKYLVLFELI